VYRRQLLHEMSRRIIASKNMSPQVLLFHFFVVIVDNGDTSTPSSFAMDCVIAFVRSNQPSNPLQMPSKLRSKIDRVAPPPDDMLPISATILPKFRWDGDTIM
jgi:hypothetical protein